jgi:hypothetical protein
MRRPSARTLVQHTLLAATAALTVGSRFVPARQETGPVLTKAVELVGSAPVTAMVAPSASPSDPTDAVGSETKAALDAFAASVHGLSHPRALEDAFRSYFAYKAAHPEAVKKPLLYFVDYGLSSKTPRGYVFDMDALTIVDGPFMVAHGRGSLAASDGVPTRFSNGFGAATTSLGLYVAQELYSFVGHAGGGTYSSIGLRLMGVSKGFNDNARARGVVAHGAPYVTATRAGRSEGCPAVDQARAKTLLPKLANGALVFLFAPDQRWLANDPWVNNG